MMDRSEFVRDVLTLIYVRLLLIYGYSFTSSLPPPPLSSRGLTR